MMKFASFETIVELIYKYAIPKPKEECSKALQLGVSFAGGYVAGVLCAIVSHPADNLVSFLNNAKGATVGDAVNKLGVWGLFTRGLPLGIVMIGTLTGAQWGIYDHCQAYMCMAASACVCNVEALSCLLEADLVVSNGLLICCPGEPLAVVFLLLPQPILLLSLQSRRINWKSLFAEPETVPHQRINKHRIADAS
ncbi:unnamed protein product [Ilex paraguariensis]